MRKSKFRLIFNNQTKMIFLMCSIVVSILISSFVAETRNEFLPIGSLESEQLITNFEYWSFGTKRRSDQQPSNLFLSLSKWDINLNHQINHQIHHHQSISNLNRSINSNLSKIQIITNL